MSQTTTPREVAVHLADRSVVAGNDAIAIVDPATGQIVSRVPSMTKSDVDEAVEAARRALQRTPWPHDGRVRARLMLEWADRIESNVERLARSLVEENGKVLAEARFEIANQANVVRYNAGLARNISGRMHSYGEHSIGAIAREPIGLVAVISPWNWPIALMVRDLAPALAAGNAVLVKPASQTAGVSSEVLALLSQCDSYVAGIVNVVTGSGKEVGQALVEHPAIDMIAFTGDGSTGRQIARSAANTLKKVALELGGKAPFIVSEDADIDLAVANLVTAIFTTTSGQICTAPSRLVVHQEIESEVTRKIAEAVANLRVGSGFDPLTNVGPLSTRGQLEKVQAYIELGQKEAVLLAGGTPIDDPDLAQGHFLRPAVFTDVDPESDLANDEIFGPVLIVQPYRDDEEAISTANSSPFGLSAAIFTQNLNRAWEFSRRIQAGTIWINTYNKFYPEAEVGGYKASGIGRMAGIEGLHEFTQTKHINFDTNPQANAIGRR